jgi:hypothetical protein
MYMILWFFLNNSKKKLKIKKLKKKKIKMVNNLEDNGCKLNLSYSFWFFTSTHKKMQL